jgi:hypothetical protein
MVALVKAPHQDADPSHLIWLLRARPERPHGCTSDKANEFTSPHSSLRDWRAAV